MTTERPVIGAPAPTTHLADSSPPPPKRPRSAIHELGRFMPRLIAGSFLLACGEVIAGMILLEPTLLASAALSAVFGLLVVVVGRLLRVGHDEQASYLMAAGMYALGLLAAVLIADIGAIPAMLPILSVVLLLPGRDRRAVGVLVAVAMAGGVLALLLTSVPHPFQPLREPFGSLFESAMMLALGVLILGSLTDFATHAQDSLDGLRRALQSQADASEERTAIVASLGRLERRDTIEETAGVFVDALMKLPDVDLAGVFACEGRDLKILALFGPPTFPLHAGDLMPEPRARHLLDRSRDGPWAERWSNDPIFAQYGEAFTATGVKGQAYAPFFDNGVMIGIVAIGTQSETHAEHLMTALPAVAEFAATASLLLTPMLVARRETALAREAIEAIIATGTYHPVFQPIVELETGRTVGFEALTRFADGRRPDIVFGAATHAGLGFELELGTLEVAMRAARALPRGTWLSLNVSPGLVVDATGLTRLLADRDRPVVLEITEHVVIDDYRAVRTAVDRFGADVRIAVDDAGAGVANFSHLVELRPRLVKVDAGLIRDLDTDLARQAVVVGLVHFAAKAGCEVIAEGIETEAERATAHALGVTHGQGYLIARPAPVSDFTEPRRVVPAAAIGLAPLGPARARSRRVRVGFLDPSQLPATLAPESLVN